MPRLSNLQELLFPVEEYPLFTKVKTQSGEKNISIPDRKAIVNTNTNHVLGVVSRNYRLVTNQEALDLSFRCCKAVFPETKAEEWVVKSSDAPSTGSYCYIDLVHNSAALDFQFVAKENRPEAFGSFIRVTNSYNALRALAFDIGLYRKVCENGLILPQSIVQLKFNHLQRSIGNDIQFEIAYKRLNRTKTNFFNYLEKFRQCSIKSTDFEKLLFTILRINTPKDLDKNPMKSAAWGELTNHLKYLGSKYMYELGENAYALFNAITEFASHPLDNRCIHRDRHSFQKLAGDWVNTFGQECQQIDFNISDYLAKLLNNTNGNGDENKRIRKKKVMH